MLPRAKPKDSSPSRRKVTPPSPTYMNNEQFGADAPVQNDPSDAPTNRRPPTATYLAGLRENRANRPSGARPLPPSTRTRLGPVEQLTSTGRSSIAGDSIRSEPPTSHRGGGSDLTKPRGSRPGVASSVISRYSANTVNTASGRDYYPDKPAAAPLRPSDVVPTATYIERGQRWMEKEEAFSLHQAMDALDIKDEEKEEQAEDDETRLYNAALDEAAELVYRHEHGIKPPEPDAPYRYKPHMRKNSYAHARTASVGLYGVDIGATGLARDSIRSFSGSSSGSDRDSSPGSERGSLDQQRNLRTGSTSQRVSAGTGSHVRASSGSRRRSSMRRNISGEIEKPFSGDQIWEEPEGAIPEGNSKLPQVPVHSQPLGTKTRNSPSKVQFALDSASEPGACPLAAASKSLSQIEIHKNPPTQSRSANYTSNEAASSSPRTSQDIPRKNGVEIRSDDIRQATSMRLKDRSARLPTPSAVSDSPGRPIVSFDKNWKAPEEVAADPTPDEFGRIPVGIAKKRPGSQDPLPPVPAIVCTPDIPGPTPPAAQPSRRPAAVPSIQVDPDGTPRGVPVIAISGAGSGGAGPAVPTIMLPSGEDSQRRSLPDVPTIVTPDQRAPNPSSRPLPDPRSARHTRNAPGGGSGSGGLPKGHWSPAPGATSRATATCHECGYPIEGRFVALSGGSERFHPQCFRCHACGTGLEALEISPEPDDRYAARVDRIRRRRAGEVLAEEKPGETAAEDGDERLRFFCHLDWHERFAPQCKHCGTPILGEHVVALGAHWHYGHFFCAECGDPFERGTTHIEKDGYAWCVACQTKRTERRAPKCRRCRVAVLGHYVKALGAEWHDECFRCATCGGGFDDGQIFPVGEGESARVLCTPCRAQELKR
ncbi:putative LIM domain-containing protein [Rosellinia necatrix]|uniref:Putative LIM domain-containing protein n=1 Tax=Rosellinia necatrix TaxID=77044 RepID=A0A1W2TUY0_ROSNE|nr:putative LIM domain-containing protein [Rosellinia necatrix]